MAFYTVPNDVNSAAASFRNYRKNCLFGKLYLSSYYLELNSLVPGTLAYITIFSNIHCINLETSFLFGFQIQQGQLFLLARSYSIIPNICLESLGENMIFSAL